MGWARVPRDRGTSARALVRGVGLMGPVGEALTMYFVQTVALALTFSACWALFKGLSR